MEKRSSPLNVPVIVVGLLVLAVDGFDQAASAVTAPQLAAAWGLPTSAFTLPIVATNAGIVIGYTAAGWLAARVRTAPTLYAGLAVAAIGSALSAIVLSAESVPMLTLVRAFTGLGIGVVLPIAISLTTSLNPDTAKERITALMTVGLIAGTGIGGLTGRPLMSSWGPAGVYWTAALVSIVVALAATTVVPRRDAERRVTRDGTRTTADEAHKGGARELLGPGTRVPTLLLWGFALLVFVTAHVLTSWTPALLVMFGFESTVAPIGLTFTSLGAILGGLYIVWSVKAWGITRAVTAAAVVTIVFLVLVGLVGGGGQALLLLLLVAVGAGVGACQVAVLAMAVSAYPKEARTAGVGYAAAAGRVGSIAGPVLGGVLIALSFGPSAVVLVSAVPIVVALVLSVALGRRLVRQEPTDLAYEEPSKG